MDNLYPLKSEVQSPRSVSTDVKRPASCPYVSHLTFVAGRQLDQDRRPKRFITAARLCFQSRRVEVGA
jgi:hypothetical protein